MHRTRDKGLLLIAFLKILKGLSLLLIGVGALHLLHKDVEAIASYWCDVLRIDSDSRFFGHIGTRLMAIDDRQLRVISAVTFFYSTVMLTEGIGLFMGQRWAELLTIIATASFLPFELFEVIAHFSLGRVVLLLVNIAVVGYLIWVVRKKDASLAEKHSAAKAGGTP
ncbi:MAG: hypothetical protein JWO20_983 [Candidatus Angelobacter sp.]|jgi:uncharacterized membrane protein (DUF2068 family)|nr:hypothetical protein [Candidatus Angelobacter sp.]